MIGPELNSLTLEKIKDYMVHIGEKSYRGEQIFSYFHRNNGTDISGFKLLPQSLRDRLSDIATVNKMKIYKKFTSALDDTKKYLVSLQDNNIIESVMMEYGHGYTACVSTQIGCKMGCSFCASTKEGLVRNLTPAEMVNQIYLMEEDLGIKISNIVLMGSGEPLDNYNNVLDFIGIISSEKGHNISLRSITISTCGIVPRIYDLANKKLPITLSISLHSPFNDERKKIMPITIKYPIDEVINACKYYWDMTKRRITFEYTLIEGVNDRQEDINELGKLLRDFRCHVNLIPLNPIEEYKKDRPNRSNIERFQRGLKKYNISVTIRKEMGGDISASCGQLRRSVTQDDKYKGFQWGGIMVSGAISDVGKTRENNQDAFYVSKDSSLPLYMVADGMGGHNAGEVASTMAMKIIGSNFAMNKGKLTSKEKILKLIKNSIEEANTKIYLKSLESEECQGMGTTITLAYIHEGEVLLGHVGDSRAYLIRRENIEQLTEDHSFVNELIKIGSITKEQAVNHPKKNMITRAVGSSSIIESDLIARNFKKDDILFLCSDGLFNMINDLEIVQVFNREHDIQKACETLANLANHRGGLDNITVVAIKFNYEVK